MFKRKSKSSSAVTTPSPSMQQRPMTTCNIRQEIKPAPQQQGSSSSSSGQMPPPPSSSSLLPSFGGRSQRQAPRLLFRLVAFLSSPRVIAAAALLVVVLLLIILLFSISSDGESDDVNAVVIRGGREESSSAAKSRNRRRRTSSDAERIIPKPALPMPRFHVHFVAIGDDVTAGHYRPKLFGPLIESRPYHEGLSFSLTNRSRVDQLLWRRIKNDKTNEEREDGEGIDGDDRNQKERQLSGKQQQQRSSSVSSPVYPLELAAAYARHVGRVDGSHHPPKLVSATLLTSEDVRARQLASLASRVRAQKGYELLKKREELGLDTFDSSEGEGANIVMMPNSEVVRKLIRSELGPFFEHYDVELLARLYYNSVSSVLLLPSPSKKGSASNLDKQKERGGEEEKDEREGGGEKIGRKGTNELFGPSLSPSSSVHFYNALRNGSVFAPVDRLSTAAVTSLGATSALLYTQMHSDLMPYASSGPLYSGGAMRLPEGYFMEMESDKNSVVLFGGGNSHNEGRDGESPDAVAAAVADAEHAGGEGSVFGLARLRRVNPLHGKQNAGVGADRHGGGVPIPEAPWLFNNPTEVEARRQAAIEAANRYRRKNPSSQVGGWHAVKSLLSKLYAERVAEADDWPADHWLKMLANGDAHIRQDEVDIIANKAGGIEEGDGSGSSRNKVIKDNNAATKEVPPAKRHSSAGGQHDSSSTPPRGLRFHYPFKKNDTVVIMCGVMAGTFDALTASTNLEAARVGGGVVGGVFGEGGADANNVNDGNEHKYAQNPFIHAEMSVGDSLSTIARIHKQCMGYFYHRLSRWIEEDARLWQVKFAVPPRTLDDPRIAYHLRRRREEYAREREAKRLKALEERESAQRIDGKKNGRDSLHVFHRVKSWLLRGNAAEDEKDDTNTNDLPYEDPPDDDSNTYPAAATNTLLPLLGIKIKVVAVPMETTGLALDPNGEVMKAHVMPVVGEANLHPSPISSRAVAHCVHRDPSRGDAIDGDVWRFVQSLNDDLNRAIRNGALHTIIDAAIEDSGWRADPEKTAGRRDGDGANDEHNAQRNGKKNTKKKKKKMKAVTNGPGEDDFFDENPVDNEKKEEEEKRGLKQKKRKRLALTALGTKVDFIVAPIPALGFQGLLNPPSSRSRMVNYASVPPLSQEGSSQGSSSSSLLPDPSLSSPSVSSVLWLWSDCLRLSRHGYDGVSRIISNGAQRIVTAIAVQQLGGAL